MSDDLSSKATKIEPEVAPSPDSGALSIAPRDLRSTVPDPASAENEVPVRYEPTMNALTVDENDAERVAFALWREGRTDDAIAFLEREILLEKDRLWKRDVLSERVEPHFGKPAPTIIVTPPPAEAKSKGKPKRKGRGKRTRDEDDTLVTEPVFSDASSAPLIELAAETVAVAPKAVPPFQRMGNGPVIVAALGLIIVGAAYAANLWNERRAAPVETVAPAVAVPPAITVPPVPEATATSPQDEPQQTASVTPAALEPEASEPEAIPLPASDAATEEPLPEPEQGAAADEIVTEPTEDVALVELPPSDDAATPPDELDDMAFGPEEPVVVARLPRQRPEPPANVVYAPPAPRQTATQQAALDPPPYDQPAVADDLPRPFYSDSGLPQRDTLTPAEYQALLERRAIAEDYVAQRRAIAEQSVPVERRHTILRLLRR